MNNATKAALAAAAIAGVAILAHRSHERDEEKHKNEQQTAEFERGYRDGLYHQTYHDYNRSQAYVDGYQAGQESARPRPTTARLTATTAARRPIRP
jgi:hypothetical protein